jgi:hypothetical protein
MAGICAFEGHVPPASRAIGLAAETGWRTEELSPTTMSRHATFDAERRSMWDPQLYRSGVLILSNRIRISASSLAGLPVGTGGGTEGQSVQQCSSRSIGRRGSSERFLRSEFPIHCSDEVLLARDAIEHFFELKVQET